MAFNILTGASDPFPGADAGVYTVADATEAVSTLTGKVDGSVAMLASLSKIWVRIEGAVTRVFDSDAVADATELPVAVSGETLAAGLTVTNGLETVWTFGVLGFGVWVRTHTAAVASPAALPMPIIGETFAPGLRVNAGSIQWWWDSSGEWWVRVATPDVANAANLPTETAHERFAEGSEFNPALTCLVTDDGTVYVWNGTAFEPSPV